MVELRPLPILLCLCALVCADDDAAAAQRAEEHRAWVREAFAKLGSSRSLFFNAKAVLSFAHSEEPRVLEQLLETYIRPPAEYEYPRLRYLLANGLHSRYTDSTYLGLLGWKRGRPRALEPGEVDELAEALQRLGNHPECCWLAFNIGRLLPRQRTEQADAALRERLEAKKSEPLLLAVLLEALGQEGSALLPGAIEHLTQRKWKRNAAEAVLLEAWAWAVCRAAAPEIAGRALSEPRAAQLLQLVELLEKRKKCLPRSQEAIRLALQHAFGSPRPYREAELWRSAVELGEDPFAGADEDATAVRFMGIETSGERIIFLIDASDSMLNALDPAELESLRGPVTGGDDDAYEIDWNRVETRFDAAREHVKQTLAALDDEVRVAVILFGEEAEPLEVTPGFVELSRKRRRAIFANLDAIEPGPVDAQHPLGQLMGQTSYAGALWTAFRLLDDTGRTRVDGEEPPYHYDEHYGEAVLLTGAETIYLLSDGAPNIDRLPGRGPRIELDYTRVERCNEHDEGARWVPPAPPRPARQIERLDKETGVVTLVDIPAYPGRDGYWIRTIKERRETEPYFQNGPFAENRLQDPVTNAWATIEGFDELVREVERLNLLRRCRIHCIGIGEAERKWLEAIARIGRGELVFLVEESEEDEEDAP